LFIGGDAGEPVERPVEVVAAPALCAGNHDIRGIGADVPVEPAVFGQAPHGIDSGFGLVAEQRRPFS